MVIIAAVGAGLGVAAWPHADIARIDRWRTRRGGARDEALKRRRIETAVGEGSVEAAPATSVEAAPATAVDRLQAEMDWGDDGAGLPVTSASLSSNSASWRRGNHAYNAARKACRVARAGEPFIATAAYHNGGCPPAHCSRRPSAGYITS